MQTRGSDINLFNETLFAMKIAIKKIKSYLITLREKKPYKDDILHKAR
jgi:hypothetical protein